MPGYGIAYAHPGCPLHDPEPTSYIVPIPDGMPALNLNSRAHWSKNAPLIAQWRMVVKAAVKKRGVPKMTRAKVTLHAVPPDNRRRDQMNLVATSKACLDGFVDSGRVKDDTPEFVDDSCPVVLHEPDGVRRWRWWLSVTDVSAAVGEAS